jgi:uncharacterized repeat protein (TIGR02543 family)
MNSQISRNRAILLLVAFLLMVVAPIGISATAVDPAPTPEVPRWRAGEAGQDRSIEFPDAETEAAKPPMVGGLPWDAPLVFSPEQPASTLAPTSPPTITIWYGPTQSFGQKGKPQQWVNILGNASSPLSITSLTYKLNGGAAQPLKIGPDRRLDEPGDFNAEISFEDLNPGANTVVITATDASGSSSQTVTVNYSPGNVWPLPYTIQWNSGAPLQNLVQVVDGRWGIESNTVRTLDPGYDRLLAFGDMGPTWKDYEVTVPVIVHGIDQDGFNSQGNGAGVGFITRWRGHYQIEDELPRQGWRNLGALAWFRWNIDGTKGLEMRGFGGAGIDSDPNKQLAFGETYMLKISSLTNPNPGGLSFYRFKVWEQGQPEPPLWDVEGFGKTGELPSGSAMLVAHNVDVTFGPVTVTPLAGVTSTITRSTDGNGIISLTPDQPSYTYAQRVGIRAIGNIGYKFSGWGGDLSGTQNPFVVNITQDMNVTAAFEPAPPPVVTVNSNGSGSVAVTPDKDEYQYGEIITVTATADPGYVFAGWSGDLTGSQNPATVVVNSDVTITGNFTEANPDSLVSDDFSCGLNPDLWTFLNPAGGSYDTNGTQLLITAPAGPSHDPWTDGNKAPRMMQSVDNPQIFEVETKFESAVTQQFQMQGIMAEKDGQNFLRFEYQYNGGGVTRVFAASIVDGALDNQAVFDVAPLGAASYLRLTRADTLWSFAYSANGTDWTPAGGFEFDVDIARVGVYAANHPAGGGSSPAHTAVVDYFFNTASPIVPEDEPDSCDPFSFPVFLPIAIND